MQSFTHFSLKNHNTFGIDVNAQNFVQFDEENELEKWLQENAPIQQDFLILGGGSNFLFTKDVDGLVLHPNFKGIAVESETTEYIYLRCGAAELWDDVVAFAVDNNWGGIENLSLIPGTIGAAPVQNIGAYGSEIESVFHELVAYEITSALKKTFNHTACSFRYRNSFFKEAGKNAYIITSVVLRLKKNAKAALNYTALQNYFEGQAHPSLLAVRQAVIEIRNSKLPDPKVLGNAGSFFKNPIVSKNQAEALRDEYPDIVTFPLPNGEVKLAAGWLIEQMGWKGFREKDAGVHKDQALVLVNYGSASGNDLYLLAMQIRSSILKEFGVMLEPEVNLIR